MIDKEKQIVLDKNKDRFIVYVYSDDGNLSVIRNNIDVIEETGILNIQLQSLYSLFPFSETVRIVMREEFEQYVKKVQKEMSDIVTLANSATGGVAGNWTPRRKGITGNIKLLSF